MKIKKTTLKKIIAEEYARKRVRDFLQEGMFDDLTNFQKSPVLQKLGVVDAPEEGAEKIDTSQGTFPVIISVGALRGEVVQKQIGMRGKRFKKDIDHFPIHRFDTILMEFVNKMNSNLKQFNIGNKGGMQTDGYHLGDVTRVKLSPNKRSLVFYFDIKSFIERSCTVPIEEYSKISMHYDITSDKPRSYQNLRHMRLLTSLTGYEDEKGANAMYAFFRAIFCHLGWKHQHVTHAARNARKYGKRNKLFLKEIEKLKR